MTNHGDMFEFEVSFISEVVWGICLSNDDNIFDTDTETPVSVISRLYIFIIFIKNLDMKNGINSPLDTVIPDFNAVLLYAIRTPIP